jgi:excinuclease ABC subunit C
MDMSESNSEFKTSLDRGACLIRALCKNLPQTPGVYRMIDSQGGVLYVGKAKALKRRVLSYSNVNKLPLRLKRMVAQTFNMEFVHTHTEVEALLLESNLIKKLKPRYNVLLRDDKSFPYILMTADHPYPLLKKHRGAQKEKGHYYGPFASGGAVNRTITIMQKAFMLRNCSDNVFAQRKRPCLQYHIKRCTAPCVNYVSEKEYAEQVSQAQAFLEGRSQEIIATLAEQMEALSEQKKYERAALLRDRIKALSAVQASQDINVSGLGDADTFGLVNKGDKCCVMVFFFRGGQNFGNRAYFPRHTQEETPENIMGAFLAQFYENKPLPPEIIVSVTPKEKTLLERAFSEKKTFRRALKIITPSSGSKKRILDFVMENAIKALDFEILKSMSQKRLLEATAETFSLPKTPSRIEVYDNSHISGTNMVGAMIVTDSEGFKKSAYRKFNIREAGASDDYGMMREVIKRRFKNADAKQNADKTSEWPDLLIIDGGAGQLSSVYEVLEELGVDGSLNVVAIAKGPDRNAGRERFFMKGRKEFTLPENDPVLHFMQRLRDEAHRFAIGTHRQKRGKELKRSLLDDVPGVGAKRKKALLNYFGSAQAVSNAGLKDLEKVEGVSSALARKIYDYFHES